MEDSKPLHASQVHKSSLLINRFHISLHCLAFSFLTYYRATFLLQNDTVLSLLWILVSLSELTLFAIWLLDRAFRWRPLSRTAFPENLPPDDRLPPVDVFVFTADPEREPTLPVMNTVLSAIAMDYPPDRLHVYLSDDGGSALTLNGMREARRFAAWWVPFCRRFGVRTRCPEAYFSGGCDGEFGGSDGFLAERNRVKEKYEEFKERLKGFKESFEDSSGFDGRNHPSVIEVIEGNLNDMTDQEEEASKLPRLVYVSREKRPSHPHHFKAGAINTLLRVSGVMSNSPFILALDCDMYCNDPASARQAMCFHLDPEISPSLAFVQFPQRFHNIVRNDIYDSQLRSAYSLLWQGLDGLDGPVLSGTGFFIKRVSLYGSFVKEGADLMELRKNFGPSNEFIKSLLQNNNRNETKSPETSKELLEEAKFLASCSYGSQTKWGQEVGFLHYSVAEDYLTGFVLQCKGWKSVYLSTPKPQFLGSGVMSLNDLLTQGTRWSSGLVEVGISKFCPFTYGPSKMSFAERMCYANLSFFPLYFLPIWCFATVPQLCLLNGIPLYPEVSNSYFITFLFIFVSAVAHHYYEVLSTGGSIRSVINEQRIWMIKSATSHMYGSLDALMKRFGLREASFLPTNKVEDNERLELYEKGLFDFRTSPMFLAPMVGLVTLNMVSFIVGIGRAIVVRDLDKMFVQVFMSFYVLLINYPIFEGMVLRKDKGRIPKSVSVLSAIPVFMLVCLQMRSRIIMY